MQINGCQREVGNDLLKWKYEELEISSPQIIVEMKIWLVGNLW